MAMAEFASTRPGIVCGLFAILVICLVQNARSQIAGPQLHLAAYVFDAGGGAASNGSVDLKASAIGESVTGRSTDGITVLIHGFAGVLQATLADTDEDGLNGAQEAALGTKPYLKDSDGDDVSDFDEINRDGDPTNYTVGIDTDPLNPDTDGDGIKDGDDLQPLIPQMQIPFVPALGLLAMTLLILLTRRLSEQHRPIVVARYNN